MRVVYKPRIKDQLDTLIKEAKENSEEIDKVYLSVKEFDRLLAEFPALYGMYTTVLQHKDSKIMSTLKYNGIQVFQSLPGEY